jgi:hypothetical protein
VARQVNVQLAPGADLEQGKAAVARVPGVIRVRQVFPDDEDGELRRMFVLDVDAVQKDATVLALREVTLVEEAELVPQRGLP